MMDFLASISTIGQRIFQVLSTTLSGEREGETVSLRAVTDQSCLLCEQHRETADIATITSHGYSLHMFLEDKFSAFVLFSL